MTGPNNLGNPLTSILEDPSFFPHSIDDQTGEFIFVPTNREMISKASFLDGREPFWFQQKEFRVPQKEIQKRLQDTSDQSPPLNLILHTGFCCSTLLARCLDQEGVCLSLKEPKILNYFSQTRPFNLSGEARLNYLRKLKLSLSLLSRKHQDCEEILIKPSNIDTVLIEEIRALRPNSKIIFIYSDLKNFLISVAKGGQPRRDFIRRLFAHYLADFKTRGCYDPNFFGQQENLVWNLSDLHIAAAAWNLQMRYLRETCGQKVYWVNADLFLRSPSKTLGNLNNFLGFHSKDQTLRQRNLKEALARHAKAPTFSYNPEKRETDLIAIEKYLSPVLPEVLAWAENVFPLWEKNKPTKIAV